MEQYCLQTQGKEMAEPYSVWSKEHRLFTLNLSEWEKKNPKQPQNMYSQLCLPNFET